MRYKLICCEVFYREICQAILDSDHTIFPVFTTKLSHVNPDYLRDIIQDEIDKTDPVEFKSILLGYGLCGNAVVGLKAKKIPLVIPRAHDCCTIFLGSKASWQRHFGNRPSCRWTSGGYMADGNSHLRKNEAHSFLGLDLSYDELVEKYGEENARFILDSLKPKDGSDELVIYIKTSPYERMNFQNRMEKEAKEKGMELETIQGDNRLIEMLVGGNWPVDEFLIVPPGYTIEGVYDQNEVMKAGYR
jgi:hypothetical protein